MLTPQSWRSSVTPPAPKPKAPLISFEGDAQPTSKAKPRRQAWRTSRTTWRSPTSTAATEVIYVGDPIHVLPPGTWHYRDDNAGRERPPCLASSGNHARRLKVKGPLAKRRSRRRRLARLAKGPPTSTKWRARTPDRSVCQCRNVLRDDYAGIRPNARNQDRVGGCRQTPPLRGFGTPDVRRPSPCQGPHPSLTPRVPGRQRDERQTTPRTGKCTADACVRFEVGCTLLYLFTPAPA